MPNHISPLDRLNHHRNPAKPAAVFIVSHADNHFTVWLASRPWMIFTDGRELQFLLKLKMAGRLGLTTAELPSNCKVSRYVKGLRKKGVKINISRERHDGPFAGNRARYVLVSNLQLLKSNFADNRLMSIVFDPDRSKPLPGLIRMGAN